MPSGFVLPPSEVRRDCGAEGTEHIGEMPEWLNGAVSKTVEPLAGSLGSNPSLSAKQAKFEDFQGHDDPGRPRQVAFQ